MQIPEVDEDDEMPSFLEDLGDATIALLGSKAAFIESQALRLASAARGYMEILNNKRTERTGEREGQVGIGLGVGLVGLGTAKVVGGTAANTVLLHGAKKFTKGVKKVQKGVGTIMNMMQIPEIDEDDEMPSFLEDLGDAPIALLGSKAAFIESQALRLASAARRYREILNDGRAGRREGQVGIGLGLGLVGVGTAKVAGGTAANAVLLHGAKKFNKGVLKVQKGVGIATAAVGIKANTVLKHGVKKVNHGVKKVLKGVGAAKVAAGIAGKKVLMGVGAAKAAAITVLNHGAAKVAAGIAGKSALTGVGAAKVAAGIALKKHGAKKLKKAKVITKAHLLNPLTIP